MTQEWTNNHTAFVWAIVERLHGGHRQSEYQKLVLSLVVLRCLDAVLEPTKGEVLDRYAELEGRVGDLEPILEVTTGEQVCDTAPLTMSRQLLRPGG